MPENDDEAVTAAVTAIKRYLDAHPHAADTAEGITRWWLTRQRFEETVASVEQALEYLVATGEVTKTLTADGKALYSRAEGSANGG